MLEFDSAHYHKIALQIADGKGFSDEHGNPQFYRVPGYPIFLAYCYKILGTNPIFIILLQILLSALISLLIVLLALTLFPGQLFVAKLAALISCFDIGYAIFSGLILTEILFVLFFTIFLILFLQKSTPRLLNLFLAGVFLGLACLVRQVAPAMLGVSIFLLLFTHKKLTSFLSFTSGFLFATSWWLARNYMLTGYIFFGTLSGPHFLNHSAVQLEMMLKNISHAQAKLNVYQEFNLLVEQKQTELGRPLQEIEKCLLAEKLTIKYSLTDPIITIKHWTINILKTAFGLYSSELLFIDSGGQLPPYSNNRSIKTVLKKFLTPDVSNKFIIPIIYFEILLFLFILLGFFLFCFSALFNFDKFCIGFKAISFIGAMLFITLACGYARLRLPIECFLIILASKAWFDILKGK
jgi:4-amino-4-deoxy-L-arabinose transferase-like glycosyltransferase